MAAAIREFGAVGAEQFEREIVAAGEPAVLRGLVADWASVARARESDASLASYLRGLDSGAPVDAVMTPPEEKGRLFYNASFDGFNFMRNRLPLSAVVEQVMRYGAFDNPPAVAVQSALLRECLPGFQAQNRLALLDGSILPRIWIGNRVTTPTHLDEWCNIACVVAGRRRFTLFAPEQIVNLYVGPLDFAPTGAPVCLAQPGAADDGRFPRFSQALEAAPSTELGPGDALYIPPLWWHHVVSLDALNVLVNYWWHAQGGPQGDSPSGFDCLLHSIASIRSLPPATRAAWKALFDHYIFSSPEAATAHIAPARRGVLGDLDPERTAQILAALARRLDPGAR
jgi:hypothetical protein